MPEITSLDNGLRVVTQNVPDRRSVSVGVLIDAGPQDDPSDRLGLAHVCEHAAFLGTHGRTAGELCRLMDSAGGQMGAFTSRDYTCIYADVLDDYITFAMELVGDILVNSVVPEDGLNTELQAIQRELAMRSDTPAEELNTLLKASAWSQHPLGRPVHGTEDGIASITRDDVCQFFSDYYAPDGLIISAAGNVDHDQFTELCQDAFWSLEGQRPRRSPESCRQQTTVKVLPSAVSQAYFCLSIPGLAYTDADRYALFVINNVLGGGLSSRLHRELRERCGLVYSVRSEVHSYRDGGMLVIEGATSPDHLVHVVTAVLNQLFLLLSGEVPPNEEELATTVMQLRGQHLLSAGELHTVMSRLATQEFYFGRSLPENEIVSGIEQVTPDTLSRVSERLLAGVGDLAVTATGPEPWASAWDAELTALLCGSPV